MANKQILVSEVGPRDCLQSIDAILPTEIKKNWILAMVDAGIQEIEVGSFVPASIIPQLADTAEIVSQIERFKTSPAILSWYISDEPDGAGEHAGPPVGMSPAKVRAAYDAAKRADPYHPVRPRALRQPGRLN